MSDQRLILIGRVAGAFGVRGELRITCFGDDPLALLGYRDLRGEDGVVALTLTAGRAAKGGLIARAREVVTRDDAEAVRGLMLYILRDALAAPDEDEFYLADLVGLETRDASGAVTGRVKAVDNFGAGDLLEILPPSGPSFWLPFTRDAVPEIDIAGGWLVIRPPEAAADDGQARGDAAER